MHAVIFIFSHRIRLWNQHLALHWLFLNHHRNLYIINKETYPQTFFFLSLYVFLLVKTDFCWLFVFCFKIFFLFPKFIASNFYLWFLHFTLQENRWVHWIAFYRFQCLMTTILKSIEGTWYPVQFLHVYRKVETSSDTSFVGWFFFSFKKCSFKMHFLLKGLVGSSHGMTFAIISVIRDQAWDKVTLCIHDTSEEI